MREWIEELSEWMENQEKAPSPLSDLTEEIHQAALETDSLLEASQQLQMAYSSLVQKVDHADS